MMNQNANLTTLLENASAKRKQRSIPKGNTAENSTYLTEAAEYIASKGGAAFVMVNGEKRASIDTKRMIEVLESQASLKSSWQPLPQDQEAPALLNHSQEEVLLGAQVPVKERIPPTAPERVPQGRGKAKGTHRVVQWGSTNQTKFFKPQDNKDLPSREHGSPRSECTWKNSHSLNVSNMSVEMDVSEICVSGYFSSVQPLFGQKAKMEKDA